MSDYLEGVDPRILHLQNITQIAYSGKMRAYPERYGPGPG